MNGPISYALIHTLLAAAFGVTFGVIISGVAFPFIGWTVWPSIVVGPVFGVVSGIRAYVFATQPWRG